MKILYLWWLLVAVAVCAVCCQRTIEVEKIKELIKSSRTANNEFKFIAGFVRLAFHDCVGPNGCNGCIDHNKDDNKGLKVYTDALDKLHTEIATDLSVADFYALSALVALDMGISDDSRRFTNSFLEGRINCTTSPGQNAVGQFPRATDGIVATLKYFSEKFGFNSKETVALLGAHTLGRTTVTNSGFNGPWVDTQSVNNPSLAPESTLDNQYYKELLLDWQQQPIGGKFQWEREHHSNMLLNCDLALTWDLNVTNIETGEVSCKSIPAVTTREDQDSSRLEGRGRRGRRGRRVRADKCPMSHDTVKTVRLYSKRNKLWLKDFQLVFLKMISRGLQPVADPRYTSVKQAAIARDESDILAELNELEDQLEELIKHN